MTRTVLYGILCGFSTQQRHIFLAQLRHILRAHLLGYDPLNVCGQGNLGDVPCGEDGVEVMYCLPVSSLYSHQAVALWGKGDLRFLESSGLQFTAYELCLSALA